MRVGAQRGASIRGVAVAVLVAALMAAFSGAAHAHPGHDTLIIVGPADAGVEVKALVPVDALEAAIGREVAIDSVGPLDTEVAMLANLFASGASITDVDGEPWTVVVESIGVERVGAFDHVAAILLAWPPDGERPPTFRLAYHVVIDEVPAHRAFVAQGAEILGTIDRDRPSLTVALASDTASTSGPTASLEMRGAGVPSVIGDVVLDDDRAAIWLALGAALVLGAVHAVAPGHGKTLTAAYLVGSRGRPRHAVALGLTTAMSHTIGVALLGVVTLVFVESLDSDAVSSALGTISGIAVTGIGAGLLWRMLRRRHDADTHSHAHTHGHGHDRRAGASGVHHRSGRVTWWGLAGLGLAGGLVPSASAVVLFLVALRFGRPGLGVVLVLLFGLGMSAVLVGSGLLALGAKGAVTALVLRRWGASGMLTAYRLAGPVAAAAVTVVGVVWTAQSLG